MQFSLKTEVCKIDILFFGEQLKFLCEYVCSTTGCMTFTFIVADKLFAAECNKSSKAILEKNIEDICYSRRILWTEFDKIEWSNVFADIKIKWSKIKHCEIEKFSVLDIYCYLKESFGFGKEEKRNGKTSKQ